MLKYRDFVPIQIEAPGIFKHGQHETFDDAVEAANQWLATANVKLIKLETVVLPNIWVKWEEGSTDASLGTSGESPNRWHQFLRCWYQENSDC